MKKLMLRSNINFKKTNQLRRWQTGICLLSLSGQKKVSQETPPRFTVRACQGRPHTLDSSQTTGLRNSRDQLRVHALKQSSPKSTDVCGLSSAVLRG
jgi:hypothetical protein